MAISSKKANALTLRIELCDWKPSIWREVIIPLNFTFEELHHTIQISMGWENAHLHQFQHNQRLIGPFDEYSDGTIEEEGDIRVDEIFTRKGVKVQYEYDFGDSWEHLISCQGHIHTDQTLPIITKGKHACPPEDCGGIPGYENLLNILKDPQHPEYGETTEWLGDDFDPTCFDLEEANAILYESISTYSELTEDGETQDDFDSYFTTLNYDPNRTPEAKE